MNIKRVYQCSLVLPLLVPMLCLPALYILGVTETRTPATFVLLTVIYSGMTGGIPYAILAFGMLFWMRDKDEPAIRKVLLLSPLLMLAVFTAYLVIYSFMFGVQYSADDYTYGFFRGMLITAPFILIFGYIYVLFTFAAVAIFRGLRWAR